MTEQATTELTSSFLAGAAPEVKDKLAASVTLRQYLQNTGTMTLDERRLLVDQALVLFEQNYVHLPPKVALHAVNPVQALRLLQIRLDRQTPETMDPELDFHADVAAIFHSVRDLHTNYLLPAPFAGKVAYLPFLLEEYYDEADARHYVVAHIAAGFTAPGLVKGVEVTHWNGVPIDRAVDVNAARYAGSNAAARHARGLQSLTVRPLVMQLPPDELWVTMSFTDAAGTAQELRVEWLVVDNLPSFTDSADAIGAAAATMGLDVDGHATGLAKTLLFAPAALAPSADAQAADPLASTMPTVFRARTITTPSGTFGHIRIFTFSVNDPALFTTEFIRLMALLPQNGLVVDVRDNGGGHLWASEGTLQTLTPQRINPEPTEFINLPLNLRICRKHKNNPTNQIDLGPWYESLERDRELGAPFSEGFPITPPDYANAIGQRYHGPVVLITNARCYSATDFFAAGFADHAIGVILGTDPNTGAGGANVWTHGLLKALMDFAPADPTSPYRDLPKGANLRVAIRRSSRVGAKSGVQLEDLGVVPHEVHRMTRNDVLGDNADLMAHAGRLLAAMPVRSLDVQATKSAAGLQIHLTAAGIERAMVWLDGEPQVAASVGSGGADISVADIDGATSLRVQGYAGDALVAYRMIALATIPSTGAAPAPVAPTPTSIPAPTAPTPAAPTPIASAPTAPTPATAAAASKSGRPTPPAPRPRRGGRRPPS
jgi:Peptidase family S41